MGMSNVFSRRVEIDYRETVDPGGDLGDGEESPAQTAAATFLAFILAGWTPLALLGGE